MRRLGSMLALVAAAVPLPAQQLLRDESTALVDAQWSERSKAIDNGLAWLARNQTERGCWTADTGHKQMDSYLVLRSAEEQRAHGEGHIGVTAIAGLAFLAGGHLPDRGPHGAVVRRTLEYVLAHVDEDGYVTDGGTRMYSHAFATLYLAQVCGMTQDTRVRGHLERAVNWIVDCQNSAGAWRYNPFTTEADLSVTVCQLQALRAARNIGIHVPAGTVERATEYVRKSQIHSGPDKGLFSYKIRGPDAYRKNTEYAINAAAVTSLFSAGIYEEQLYGPALDFVQRSYDEIARYYPDHFYYWYGNYYASQALYHAGQGRFPEYWKRISRDLLQWQQSDGRWVDRVGPGDVFSTAVACIILQIPYQYLPIFQR